MYRVLLADDEPIILSGLQSMLSWERLDCTVCGTARNGRQALELVEARRPDIVICDINMPLLTGLELLETCARRWPDIVFIMLTNHQDFHMAQQSLRGRAVDYLLKIELDEEKLERSMRMAINEREKRRRLFQPAPAQPGPDPAEAAARQAAALLSPEGGYEAERAIAALEALGAGTGCAAVLLVMDPAAVPNISSFIGEERKRLFSFHRSLALDTAQKVFQGVGWTPLPPEKAKEDTAALFLWGLEDDRPIAQFQTRLAAAIGITPNYLSSLFKRQLGQNFMDYVNATKVKYACALLQDGTHMVYEVSHMLGYDNAYYFTKVFKRYMKMTPKEYQSRAVLQANGSER